MSDFLSRARDLDWDAADPWECGSFIYSKAQSFFNDEKEWRRFQIDLVTAPTFYQIYYRETQSIYLYIDAAALAPNEELRSFLLHTSDDERRHSELFYIISEKMERPVPSLPATAFDQSKKTFFTDYFPTTLLKLFMGENQFLSWLVLQHSYCKSSKKKRILKDIIQEESQHVASFFSHCETLLQSNPPNHSQLAELYTTFRSMSILPMWPVVKKYAAEQGLGKKFLRACMTSPECLQLMDKYSSRTQALHHMIWPGKDAAEFMEDFDDLISIRADL